MATKRLHYKILKLYLPIAAAFVCGISAHALPYFSGLTGGGIDLTPVTDEASPDLSVSAFFAGQFDLTKNVIFRTQMNVKTENILGDNLLEDTPAVFNLEEASVTYQGNIGVISHFITCFIGNIDPVGSDIFMRRMFGVPAFSSKLTETLNGLCPTGIYPISGIGLTYTLKMTTGLAAGFYMYYNKTTTSVVEKVETAVPDFGNQGSAGSNDADEIIEKIDMSSQIITTKETNKSLNFDMRFAGVWDSFLVDAAAGFSLPLEDQDDAGEDVILIIRKADFHAGLTCFIGSSYMSSLFVQAGITKLILNPEENESVLSFNNVYCLIEPRFVTPKVCFSLTLFNIPESSAHKLYYISNPLGVNVSIYSNNLSLFGRSARTGVLMTVSLPESTMDIDADMLELQLAPFGYINIGSSRIDAIIKCNVLECTTFDNFLRNTLFTLSYQVKL